MNFTAKHMQEIGKLGGQSTSERKQEASRANGKLGGRPRGKKLKRQTSIKEKEHVLNLP